MIPDLSNLSLAHFDANAATQTNQGEYEPSYATAQDQVIGEIGDEIVRVLAASQEDAGDVCEAIATWCATHRQACSGDAVWVAALAAFNINTPEKRAIATRLLLNIENNLIPALTDRQLFNAICARINNDSPANDYHYDGILWLTYRSRFGNLPTTQLELDALDREYQMAIDVGDGANKLPPFWANLGRAMLVNEGESADYMRVPWHPRRPDCHDRSIMEWMGSSPEVRQMAIQARTRSEEHIRPLYNAFGEHFGFGVYDTIAIPDTITSLPAVYGVASFGRDSTSRELLEDHRDEYIGVIKVRLATLAQRFFAENRVLNPMQFGDDQWGPNGGMTALDYTAAFHDITPIFAARPEHEEHGKLIDMLLSTVRLPRDWVLNEDRTRTYYLKKGMLGGPFWPRESLSPIFEVAVQQVTEPFVIEGNELAWYVDAFGRKDEMTPFDNEVMRELADDLWAEYAVFNTGVVWKWAQDYNERREYTSWKPRHGRIVNRYVRPDGLGRPKKRVLITSGTLDRHDIYFYDLPASRVMPAHPEFNKNVANRWFDPSIQTRVNAIRARHDTIRTRSAQ